jgi:hypothetical protein
LRFLWLQRGRISAATSAKPVNKVEPLTQRPLAIFRVVLRTRINVHLHRDTVASRNTGSFSGAGKSETDSGASQWGSRLAGVEVGLDPG